MTRAEAAAFNLGVLAVVDIAARSAAAIANTTQRRVHEDFAVAALTGLAEASRDLIITDDAGNPILPATPDHGSAQ